MTRPFEPPPPTGEPRADALRNLVAIVDRLRDPEAGCPWDLAQTVESLAPSAIEEAHELVEAVEAGRADNVIEEAGDLLMVVVLLARIAEQGGRFDLARAAGAVCDKLVRRHPHVFGDADATSADGAIRNWEAIKKAERLAKHGDASAVAGVPAALPALQRTDRIGQKAIAAGFRWQDASGALAKLEEEVRELREAVENAGGEGDARVEEELGDVLLAGALVGTYLSIDPERATRSALRRFEQRFRRVEAELGERLRDATLDELVAAWGRAKDVAPANP